MFRKTNSQAGFSLVELIVVVAIISLISVSTIIGFDSLQNSIAGKQTSHFLEASIKQSQMRVVAGQSSREELRIDRDISPQFVFLAQKNQDSDLEMELKSYDEESNTLLISIQTNSATSILLSNDQNKQAKIVDQETEIQVLAPEDQEEVLVYALKNDQSGARFRMTIQKLANNISIQAIRDDENSDVNRMIVRFITEKSPQKDLISSSENTEKLNKNLTLHLGNDDFTQQYKI